MSLRENKNLTNAITVDVEDYFHVEAFAHLISRDDWTVFESRVRINTERLLDLFARYNVRGTFFFLGWVAENDAKLVRDVASAGHEIACHSFAHQRILNLTPQQFREDLRRARRAIEDAASCEVLGFRAPTFSITNDSLWALDILVEEGFAYDSSIYPVHHDRYGIADAPRFAHTRQTQSGRAIVELPPSTASLFGHNFGIAGGGYLRLLPLAVSEWGINRLHAQGEPAVVYLHPWEVDPEQPRINGVSATTKLRHYSGLETMEAKLATLLSRHRFGTMLDVLCEQGFEVARAAAV